MYMHRYIYNLTFFQYRHSESFYYCDVVVVVVVIVSVAFVVVVVVYVSLLLSLLRSYCSPRLGYMVCMFSFQLSLSRFLFYT